MRETACVCAASYRYGYIPLSRKAEGTVLCKIRQIVLLAFKLLDEGILKTKINCIIDPLGLFGFRQTPIDPEPYIEENTET